MKTAKNKRKKQFSVREIWPLAQDCLSLQQKEYVKMPEEIKNKAEYFVAFINEFAKTHHLNDAQSYQYLSHFKGIDMIDRHYGIAHTLRFEDVVSDVTNYCRRQGGML